MPERTVIEVDLKPSQVKFLQGVANEYALPDVPKAIRVLIEFAMHEPGLRDQIFAVMRCRDCS